MPILPLLLRPRSLLALAVLPAVGLAQPQSITVTSTVAPGSAPVTTVSSATVARPEATQPVTHLGVYVGEIHPALTEQLGLQPEMGLVVLGVQPESPAAGVIRQHDVLLKFNDQLLINGAQFGVLVRSRPAGDEVALTVVRGGKTEVLKVKLSQRMLPPVSATPALTRPLGQRPIPTSSGTLTFQRGFGPAERIKGALPREEVGRSLTMSLGPVMGVDPTAAGVPMIRMLNAGRGDFMFSDGQGTLQLTMDDGRKHLVVRDPAGAVTFEGPAGTPDERAALPAEVRARLEAFEGIDTIQFAPAASLPRGDVLIVAPSAEGI